MSNLETKTINTIRALSADMIEKANSGHPGLPLGFAPVAYTVWANHMKHNPANPDWIGRDRFVLSAGHGSALIYSLLHLWGYGLTMDDLQNFRQLGSKTPGHPEYKHTTGVEVTTGPLGQGIANAVGMAIAETHMAANFNKADAPLFDNYTYVISGDGCLQEGVAAEAVSMAGNLGLGKLILLYDSNNITIEGDTAITFTENVLDRFKAYGWDTHLVADANDLDAVNSAINAAKQATNKPSIIEIKSQIGYGSPRAGTAKAHGEPLGAEGLATTKTTLGLDPSKSFHVDREVYDHIATLNHKQATLNAIHDKLMADYATNHPTDNAKLQQYLRYELPDLLNDANYWDHSDSLATRISSEVVLNKLSKQIPNLIGGSADLSPSTKTLMADRTSYGRDNYVGSNMHFGIREHAMSAIANGMYLYGGLRPYVAGFFVFSDYAKPAIRLSALMKLPIINVFTHDSIGVGEDGPTHQPIEQLASLRSIPNSTVFRPADTKETAAAWYYALTEAAGPVSIALTRQKTQLLPDITGKEALKGGYVLKCACTDGHPDVILIATGSEVELALGAYDKLVTAGKKPRVVSIPSFEVFDKQDPAYRESVLPKAVRARVGIEAAADFGWGKYIGLDGVTLTMDSFGDSGEAGAVFKHFGFTVEAVVEKAMSVL